MGGMRHRRCAAPTCMLLTAAQGRRARAVCRPGVAAAHPAPAHRLARPLTDPMHAAAPAAAAWLPHATVPNDCSNGLHHDVFSFTLT